MSDAQLKHIAATHTTPCYAYDTALLQRTLEAIRAEAAHDRWHVHYAIKANPHPVILQQIARAGLGADCVSGGEVAAALQAGFRAGSIVLAGVGKTDAEIEQAIGEEIGMMNVESREELCVIEQIAARMGKKARVSLRINPDVDAHTHAHITTGRAENKFGVDAADMVTLARKTAESPHLTFTGLHFHIGSQLLMMDDFRALCLRINELQGELAAAGLFAPNINVGGGLGIDYEQPLKHPVADFRAYFATFANNLTLLPGQHLHFELGRAVVAQMGTLLTRVLYVKQGSTKQFAIVDAGMTELIRPALYGALHRIDNLSSEGRPAGKYDVVGPICESSDTFARDYVLPTTQRGDILAIRSAGAYGMAMASTYNCRPLPEAYLF